MTCRTLFDLPPVPLPPADDLRPLRHWKITAEIDCPDLKRGYSLAGVLGWPEEPAGPILHQMVTLLAIDSLVMGDNSPEDVGYSYIADEKAAPTAERLTHF